MATKRRLPRRVPELVDGYDAANILETLADPALAAFFNRRQLKVMREAVLAVTYRPPADADLKHRNFWIAMEFHWRRHRLGQQDCAKRVAAAWDLEAHQVAVIASRYKPEFERKFLQPPAPVRSAELRDELEAARERVEARMASLPAAEREAWERRAETCRDLLKVIEHIRPLLCKRKDVSPRASS